MGVCLEYVLTEIFAFPNLIDNIIYKDIIAYHKIKDEQIVKDFFKLFDGVPGKQLSLNKMAHILNIGVDTARRFQSYFFEETYLIYTVEKHGKLNERLRHPKKIYAGDVGGLHNLITGYRDKGAIFENLVYLKLKSKNSITCMKEAMKSTLLQRMKRLLKSNTTLC